MKLSSSIKIPPPIVTLIFCGLMYGLDRILTYKMDSLSQWWLITGLLFSSFVMLFPAVVQFYRSKTTVNPFKPESSKVLVVKGLYNYTRNPMYLGMALILLAWFFYLANPFNLVIFLFYIVYMNVFQIRVEEQALEVLFGDDFIQYKAKVRRWL